MPFPVRDVVKPAAIRGRQNGKLPTDLLGVVAGLAGGPTVRLVDPARRAWRALSAAATQAGHTLKATSTNDSYRPYAVQERIFRERYTNTPNGTPAKHWQGKKWFLKPDFAAAAVPGTSNHGWGLAVDTGEEKDGDTGTRSLDTTTLDWLVDNEERFGFSHEIQSERWHIRYFAGDDVPAAVHQFEKTGGADVPLSDAEAEKVASATWFRDSDPNASVTEPAWVALHNARRDAAAALKQIALMRTEFAAFNNRNLVDEQAIINGLLAALSPDQIAGAIIDALPPHDATAIADGILGRLNPDDPEGDD
jgi:hypothetical protein